MLPHFSASCSQCQLISLVVLYLSHPMLVLAELIVCSRRGFAYILAKWFWPTVMSLSLTYGSPEASCIKRADTSFGRRSASVMNTSIISMEYTSNCQIFGNQYYKKQSKGKKRTAKTTTSSN